MAMEYIIRGKNGFYNSFTGEPASNVELDSESKLVRENGIAYRRKEYYPVFSYTDDLKRLERKNNIKFFPHLVDHCYEYDVEVRLGFALLNVYEGTYDNGMLWDLIYTAAARPGMDLIEMGEHSFVHWFNMFASGYELESTRYINIGRFEHRPGTLKRVREVFPCELSPNAMLFFLKFKGMKKYNVPHYPASMFSSIPYPNANRRIGKQYDSSLHNGSIIHYAWQGEIEIDGIPFLDVVVISGHVKDGIMDVEDKHRFFLTEDYVYSPDGGDFGVFASEYFYGKVVINKFKKHANRLLLERYNGKYMYKYMYSRYFIPAFEILAKAGYSEAADAVLESYYHEYNDEHLRNLDIKYFGKNDKDIFGFKMKYWDKLPKEVLEQYSCNCKINPLIRDMRKIIGVDPSVFNEISDKDLFDFVEWDPTMNNIHDRIAYLKSIGTWNASMYIDYLRMSKDLGRYAYGHGQYPKDLKVAHDVQVVYRNEVKSVKHTKLFSERVSRDDYTKNIYIPENEEYCILAPRDKEDLIQESYRLSHCVRSYISDVAMGYTKIYFLRLQNKMSTPLVTIEVRKGRVIQARGKYNRFLTKEEIEFISKWANINNIYYERGSKRY